MSEQAIMRIKELSQKSGVTKSTIHYYLREGILHRPTKTGRTMAYYDGSHLQKLATIKRLKKDHRMPIAFLKEELARLGEGGLPQPGPSDAKEKEASPKDIRRARIVKVALDIFSKRGYHRTKVNDITTKMGISTGTFYLYFENKRELFIEVVEDVVHHIVGDAARSIKGVDDLGHKLVIRGQVFHENYTRYMDILNQLRAEISSDEDWPREKVNRMYKDLTDPLIQELREGIGKVEIRPHDPELLAYALTGMIEMMSFRISIDDKYTIDDVLRFMGELLLNGMFPEQEKKNIDVNQYLKG